MQNERVGGHLGMTGERANMEAIILLMNVVERSHLVQVNNGLWLGQPQFHQRHQTLATGQEFCLLSVLVEERQDLCNISRRENTVRSL